MPDLAQLKDLTPPMIVQWFRQQATRFNEMADFVEGTFAGGVPQIKTNGTGKVSVSTGKPDSAFLFIPENVHRELKTRNMRRVDIADLFGVPVSKVDEMISDPGAGLYVGDRGWIKALDPSESTLGYK